MGSSPAGPLARKLCQVIGVNLNYASGSSTRYHIQVEDRGPLLDRVSEQEVRRVNVIIYSNYGEPSTRIVHSRDYDFEDVRMAEYNRFIEAKVKELAERARDVIEDHESRYIERIKGLLHRYYVTKDEGAKRQFESVNALYPFLFSRAWRELKKEKESRPAAPGPSPAEPEPEAPATGVPYPLDPEMREQVLDIERLIVELGRDLKLLKKRGTADEILLQTCRELVRRAKETLLGAAPSVAPSVLNLHRLDTMRLDRTRSSLLMIWRQARSRLKAAT